LAQYLDADMLEALGPMIDMYFGNGMDPGMLPGAMDNPMISNLLNRGGRGGRDRGGRDRGGDRNDSRNADQDGGRDRNDDRNSNRDNRDNGDSRNSDTGNRRDDRRSPGNPRGPGNSSNVG